MQLSVQTPPAPAQQAVSASPGATLGTGTRGRGQTFGTQKYVASGGGYPFREGVRKMDTGATLGTSHEAEAKGPNTNYVPTEGGSTPLREGVRQMEPRCDIGHRHTGRGPKVRTQIRAHRGGACPHPPPQPTCTVPPWACPCAVGERRRWVGGRVGGWEVGRQHGERGGNQLWHHTTAFAPNVPHLPHPRGVSELIEEGPPRLLRAAVPLDLAVVLTSFPPREPTSGLADKGRLGSLGGWRTGLSAPVAAYPPLLPT